MDRVIPLSALLSRTLVAFIIEFDNEFERQMPHRTTRNRKTTNGPWLVSMVMWVKFIRFVPETGVTVRALFHQIGSPKKAFKNWLTRLWKWWGYLVIDVPVTGDSFVRLSDHGAMARKIWLPLTDTIEKRWRTRLGSDQFDDLKGALREAVTSLHLELPDSLPILGYGLVSRVEDKAGTDTDTLPALLSKLLLAFAVEFEGQSEVSLALCANVLRLVTTEGVRLRDLPRMAGVSKEAIAMGWKFLDKNDYVTLNPGRVLVLTDKGKRAHAHYEQLVSEIETAWPARKLREVLEKLTEQILLKGLKPYPDGWRAFVPPIQSLPQYPMILHRGGYPDGS